MKIIDEKGKLFGKLNLIDLLVVLVLVAVLLFVALRFAGGGNDTPAASPTKLTYTALVTGVNPQLYEEIQSQLAAADYHDQLMASGDMLDAYIVGLEATPHVNYFSDDDGNLVSSQDEGDLARHDLLFTVEAYVADPVTSQVGTQEVRVGKSHILKTTHIEFNSIIINCSWE